MKSVRCLVFVVTVALLSSSTTLATADGLDFNHTYVLVGPNIGYAFNRELGSGNGGQLGLEASIVTLEDKWFLWYGAYSDALVDFVRDEVRLSLGPEVGLGPLGIDGGYLLASSSYGTEHGFVVRPMLTVGILAVYYRFGMLVTSPSDRFGEVGVLLKAPLWELESE